MAKRLTETQKQEIIKNFTEGKTIDFLSQMFECTKLTIIRNLKRNLGEKFYKELTESNQSRIQAPINKRNNRKKKSNEKDIPDHNVTEFDFQPTANFVEIAPLNDQIENLPRKELSSVPLMDIDFPSIVYMIVDRKIELETKFLRDYPEWEFLPNEDLDRECIEIYNDLIWLRDLQKPKKKK